MGFGYVIKFIFFLEYFEKSFWVVLGFCFGFGVVIKFFLFFEGKKERFGSVEFLKLSFFVLVVF